MAGGWIGWALAGVAATIWLALPSAAPSPMAGQGARVIGTQVSGAPFTLCHARGGARCVVDGDTFRIDGQRVRIADIDTPETHPARCPAEAALGRQATARLLALLNAGPFTLTPIDRDADRYGRLLRIVRRDGRSLGGQMVAEGLARYYDGRRREGWCD